jgi:hypothetical protein
MANVRAHGDQELVVRSHVSRDLLQAASLFKDDQHVVWEYVSNSLQYVDPGVMPVVDVVVDVRQKRISISDNGRGMDWSGLQNFFFMHGENLDRLRGRAGRGRFGTGKSAAFGIADVLRVTTVRSGRRSRVELSRRDLIAATDGQPVPIRVIEQEVPTREPNGTSIEIEHIHLRSLDPAGIGEFIERHLARWRGAVVRVNHRQCEFLEPAVAEERRFEATGNQRDKLGAVELLIKIAKAPLEEHLRGVAIFSNGIWHETTLAGHQGREMSQYLFGEIDVPRLDDDSAPITPFDMSRSMRLNPSNELVQAIYGFVGAKIDEVRRELVERERRRRASEDARRLAAQATEIARVINNDFNDYRQKVARIPARGVGAGELGSLVSIGGDNTDELIAGGDVPADEVAPTGGLGHGGRRGGQGDDPPTMGPDVRPTDHTETESRGQPAGEKGEKPKPKGGFRVEFREMGRDAYRASYASQERSIYINLDHPQVVAARGQGSVEDPVFRRLAYEIAFGEYAIALGYELANQGAFLEPIEVLVSVRETSNRLARRAATLYEA